MKEKFAPWNEIDANNAIVDTIETGYKQVDKQVDKHKYQDKTKFGDWKIMEEYLEKEGCLFKLDIKQGYHHKIFKEEVNTARSSLVKYSFVINKSLSDIPKQNLFD